MDRETRATRLAAQFGGETGFWEALDLVVPADRFLNLGYSPGWRSHLVGSPQARLVSLVADTLVDYHPERGQLLDLGCGRGGPAAHLEGRGWSVVGLDLVRANLRQARGTTTGPAFVQGDAAALPLGSDSMAGATAVDTIVYVPDTTAVFRELGRVLEPDGVAVVTDLLLAPSVAPSDPRIERFVDSWDLAPLEPVGDYRGAIERAGLERLAECTLTSASVGRFRRYTTPFLWAADGPLRRPLARLADRLALDLPAVREQVRAAHEALPALRHRLFVLSCSSGTPRCAQSPQ